MSVNTVDPRNNMTADTNRNPSPAIWGDCPIKDIQEGNIGGTFFHDDFTNWPFLGTQTTEIAFSQYKVFATSGSAVTSVSAVNSVEIPGGILQLGCDTDDESASVAQAYPSHLMTGLISNSGKLWFECRIALSSILTSTMGFFIGLAETEQWTLATGVPFNSGDPITNGGSAIGFRKEEDGLGVIDTVYSDRATSFTNVGDAATSVAANTFIKLGMVYDPTDSNAVRFYANNLELTTKLTRAALTALTNLDANALGLICSIVCDASGTAAKMYMDWWRVCSVFPTVSPV